MSHGYRNTIQGRNKAHADGLCVDCRKPHERISTRTGLLARTCQRCADLRSVSAATRYLEQKAAKAQPSPRNPTLTRYGREKTGPYEITAKEVAFVEMKLDRLKAERRARRGAVLAA